MEGDSEKTISRSIRRFFSGTALSRVTGLLRTMTMSAVFGCHPALAAFLVAFRFSHLFRRLFGEGALHAAFTPLYESLRSDDKERGARFFRDLSSLLTIFLVLVTGILSLSLLALCRWGGFDPEQEQIMFLTALMLPSVVPICLYGLNSGLLHCEKKYFITSVAPVAFNLVWVLGAWALYGYDVVKAMSYLSGVVFLACIGQMLVTVLPVLTYLRNELGASWFQWSICQSDVKRLLLPLGLGLIGVGAAQINNLWDSIFALVADSQGPAHLWYSLRIQHLPMGLFAVAMSASILPPLSRAVQAGDNEQFERFLNFSLRQCIYWMLPCMGAVLVGGFVGTNLLYGRGEFVEWDVIQTTRCLWAYGLGILPLALVQVLASSLYSLHDYRQPTRFAIGAMCANILLNSIFVYGFGFGAVSVAYATTITAWGNLFFLLRTLKEHRPSYHRSTLWYPVRRMGSCTVFAVFVTGFVGKVFFDDPSLKLLGFGAIGVVSRGFMAQATVFLVEGVVYGVAIITSAYFIGILPKKRLK